MDSEIRIDVNRADLKRLDAVAEALEVERLDLARAILLGGIANAEILCEEIGEAHMDRSLEGLRAAARKHPGKSFAEAAGVKKKARPRAKS